MPDPNLPAAEPLIQRLTDVSDNVLAQLDGYTVTVTDLLPMPGPDHGETIKALIIADHIYTSRPVAQRIRAVRRAKMVIHLSQEANNTGWDFTAKVDGQTVFQRQADIDYRNQPPQPKPPAIDGRT